jgi:hypothetical protein
MAALTVVTSTNVGSAQLGNTGFVYIQTCITKAGQARTGLTKQQVTFESLLVGAGGYSIEWSPTPHGYWENHPGYRAPSSIAPSTADVGPLTARSKSRSDWFHGRAKPARSQRLMAACRSAAVSSRISTAGVWSTDEAEAVSLRPRRARSMDWVGR